MADITVLPEFSRDGDKRSDGLTELNGFPQALKPARQWMNFMLNKITVKINEVIAKVNANSNTLGGITDYFLPIGTIISSFDPDFDPNVKYTGTTWVLHGEGRVGVGLSTQSSDPTWTKTVGTEFGEYSHTLTIDEMPEHDHEVLEYSGIARAGLPDLLSHITADKNGPSTNRTGSSGSGNPHNNVQPSIVEARWRRTA